jgi:hypothetical protein
MKANKGFLAIGAKARLSQNPDVQRQKILKNYGEISTATVTGRN